MKKIAVIILACAIIALPSCKNQGKKKVAEAEAAAQEQMSQKEKYLTEELKINFENLIESVKKMNKAPFLKSGETIELTEKEKMVKPDYLLDPAVANDLVTLTQKYRVAAMLGADKLISEMYDMPVDGYEASLKKLVLDINDPALKTYVEKYAKAEDENAVLVQLMNDEYDAGRPNYFWELASAYLVEELFICTQNIDKFMPMFDDQSASDITYNFICCHENIKQLIEFYPEMQSLNEILDPLYVINAINVEQLRSQLLELKGEIAVIRTLLCQ